MDPSVREMVRAVFVKVGVVALNIRSPEDQEQQTVAGTAAAGAAPVSQGQ